MVHSEVMIPRFPPVSQMRPHRQRLIPLLALLAACGSDRPIETVTVTDSAGVRITISQGGFRAFGEVDPEPALSLGGADVSGPAQLSNIRGIHVDPRGNVWVADGGSQELRIFRPDGWHWKTTGGRGAGPGEFRRLRLLGAFRGDSVALWDDASLRLSILGPDGDLGRTVRPWVDSEVAAQPIGVFRDGTLLARDVRILSAAALEAGRVFADTMRLLRVDLTNRTTRPQAVAPGTLWLWNGRTRAPIPFTTDPGVAVRGETLYLATGPDFRIRVFENGRLAEVFGVAREARRVTPEAIDAYREFFEGAMPDSPLRRQYVAALGHPKVPSLLPAYYRVLVADDGKIWARIYAPDLLAPATWDVFSADHEWLGQVQTPARFMVRAIAGGRLVGIWRDELVVEYVRAYAFTAAE